MTAGGEAPILVGSRAMENSAETRLAELKAQQELLERELLQCEAQIGGAINGFGSPKSSVLKPKSPTLKPWQRKKQQLGETEAQASDPPVRAGAETDVAEAPTSAAEPSASTAADQASPGEATPTSGIMQEQQYIGAAASPQETEQTALRKMLKEKNSFRKKLETRRRLKREKKQQRNILREKQRLARCSSRVLKSEHQARGQALVDLAVGLDFPTTAITDLRW